MKTLIHTLFFFLLTTQICFGQWVQVGLNAESIKDISVQNQNIFAVTSDSGKVFRSVDSGANWTMIVDSGAVDVAISLTGKVFIIVNDSTFGISLHYSTDYGENWIWSNIMEQISDSLPCNLGGYTPRQTQVGPTGIVFCYVAQRGDLFFPCKWEDYFGISADDGLTWSTPVGFSNRGGALFDFKNQSALTYGETTHLMGGTSDYLSFSSDYGITWEHITGVGGVSVIGIFSNGNIILSGPWYLPGIQISTDMCGTWTQISTLNCQVGQSYSSGLEEGILVSINSLGIFLFSDEGDSLGSRNDGLTNLNVRTLTLNNNGYVYAGTDNGVWRRPLSEIVTSVEDELNLVSDFNLSQNYPNPFNPSTKIKYSVPQISRVKIKVFDILGEEIETLVNEEKSVGTYELNWNASNLPSGVYFYQLRAGEFVQVKKMILIK